MQNPSLNDSTVTTSCANILETISMRQAKTLDKFAVVIFNNQSDDINKISTEVGKRFQIYQKLWQVLRTDQRGKLQSALTINKQQ